MLTWQMWIKVLIASIPAGVVGILFNDVLDRLFYWSVPVALMLILYGVLFIVIEKRNEGRRPAVTKISELSVRIAAVDRGVPDAGPHPGNLPVRGDHRRRADHRRLPGSGGGVYFLPGDPGHVRRSLIKLVGFGFNFTAAELGFLLLGCLVSFGLSIVAIRFLMGYIKQHDFKVFGYYRIVLGGLVLLVAFVQWLFG